MSGAGVVTISASYGAGGDLVGPAVAARLDLVFHDRAIPAQVAGRLGVPLAEAEANDENVARGLWRIVASLGTMPDPMGGVVPVTEQLDERTFRLQTERVVRQGDTLASIAYQEYGDSTLWRAIALANDIDDPLRLPTGLELRVPARDELDYLL